MSTSTRVTQSKGKSDGLSLPMRMRPTRKDATSGRSKGDRDQQQQIPTQSPLATATGRAETTSPMLSPGPHRPLTPHVSLATSPIPSSISSTLCLRTSTTWPRKKNQKWRQKWHFSTTEAKLVACLQTTRLEIQCPHQRLLIIWPKVIQMHHLQLQTNFGQLSIMNFWTLTIFSCQTAATNGSTRYPIKFFRKAIWKMETMNTSWSYRLWRKC